MKIQNMFVIGAFAVLVSLIVFSTLVPVSTAATSEDSSLSASLTVNTFVDTSINQSTLSFGSLDPATSNNPASENAVGLTNTANSNTPIDIYINNTNMTTGVYYMPFTALSVHTVDSAASSTDLNGSTYANGTSANEGFFEDLAVSTTQGFYFWHDVPAGQTAGAYTATVVIHSVADGQAP